MVGGGLTGGGGRRWRWRSEVVGGGRGARRWLEPNHIIF